MKALKDDRIMRGRWVNLQLHESAEAKARGDAPIWEEKLCLNGITDVGIHYLLEVGFRSDDMAPVAQSAPWFAGLIDNASFTAVAAGDTSASHAGWIESDDYDETDRPTLAFGAAAARSITAQVDFTMNATKTLRGVFVIDDDAKNGATGILWSTALFATNPSVVSGNVLTANYTLTD